MSSVRPSISGLSLRCHLHLGLRRSGKVRCGIVIVPCHHSVCFCPEMLEFSYAGREKGLQILLHGENTVDLAIWSFLYI